MAFGCGKGGFPTLYRHLYLEQLQGLGWHDLQPLVDNPAKDWEALKTSIGEDPCVQGMLVQLPMPCTRESSR